MNPPISPQRLWRLLRNDLQRIARPVAYATLALLGVTVIAWLTIYEPGFVAQEPTSAVLFAVLLLGTGLLFTSISFHDMHHPLERYRYLMLPCSNLERFLARYLLTGPLFVLYAIVAFAVMDWIGNGLAAWLRGSQQPLFAPLSREVLGTIGGYLLLHAVMLLGAIRFRSYALLKTAVSVLLVWLGMALAMYLALRVFYWNSFTLASLEAVGPIHLRVQPLFEATWMNIAAVVAFALWLLYVAFRCLRAHEVQDEL